jgi:hypothetical protein
VWYAPQPEQGHCSVNVIDSLCQLFSLLCNVFSTAADEIVQQRVYQVDAAVTCSTVMYAGPATMIA